MESQEHDSSSVEKEAQTFSHEIQPSSALQDARDDVEKLEIEFAKMHSQPPQETLLGKIIRMICCSPIMREDPRQLCFQSRTSSVATKSAI